MLRIICFLVLTFGCVFDGVAEPFWGYKNSQPLDTQPQKLKPGQFIWKGDFLPSLEAMSTKVNLSEQRIYVYRGSNLVGVSTISTGRGRRSTPTGVFKVLEKSRHHRSNKYNNAPMPYMHRLTMDGIALHAGRLPGYPASHGCIRLPTQFVRWLFESSTVGMQVAIIKSEPSTQTLARGTLVPQPQTQNLPAQKTVVTAKAENTGALMAAVDAKMATEQAKLSKLQQEIAVIEKKQRGNSL